jgi:hypothetical protein
MQQEVSEKLSPQTEMQNKNQNEILIDLSSENHKSQGDQK